MGVHGRRTKGGRHSHGGPGRQELKQFVNEYLDSVDLEEASINDMFVRLEARYGARASRPSLRKRARRFATVIISRKLNPDACAGADEDEESDADDDGEDEPETCTQGDSALLGAPSDDEGATDTQTQPQEQKEHKERKRHHRHKRRRSSAEKKDSALLGESSGDDCATDTQARQRRRITSTPKQTAAGLSSSSVAGAASGSTAREVPPATKQIKKPKKNRRGDDSEDSAAALLGRSSDDERATDTQERRSSATASPQTAAGVSSTAAGGAASGLTAREAWPTGFTVLENGTTEPTVPDGIHEVNMAPAPTPSGPNRFVEPVREPEELFGPDGLFGNEDAPSESDEEEAEEPVEAPRPMSVQRPAVQVASKKDVPRPISPRRPAGLAVPTGKPEDVPDEMDLFGSEDEASGMSRPVNPFKAPATKDMRWLSGEAERGAPDGGAAAPRAETTSPPGVAEIERPMRQATEAEIEESFTLDKNGEKIKKWKVDYAERGGGGRATCKDLDCLERHEQGGAKVIEKGALRICRRVLMEKDGEGTMMIMWYHARCIFNTFLRSRKSTRTIKYETDLDNFENIALEDQAMLRRIIAGNNETLLNARFSSTGAAKAGASETTPNKRGAGSMAAKKPDEMTPFEKRQRLKMEKHSRKLVKGDRVWTYFRCKPKVMPDGVPALVDLGAVKSPKPELAMVQEDVVDDTVIVQFESIEAEKERLDKYQMGKFKNIRGWLRVPRIFEGKKQKVPTTWIQWDRDPPKLCGCNVQHWNHQCPVGIACSRGTSITVWGVCN